MKRPNMKYLPFIKGNHAKHIFKMLTLNQFCANQKKYMPNNMVVVSYTIKKIISQMPSSKLNSKLIK